MNESESLGGTLNDSKTTAFKQFLSIVCGGVLYLFIVDTIRPCFVSLCLVSFHSIPHFYIPCRHVLSLRIIHLMAADSCRTFSVAPQRP